MQLWRISNYANLLGERALHYDARWHTAGRRIVYLAASPAGALIEVLVHLELDEGPAPTHYQILEVELPDHLLIQDLTTDLTTTCTLDIATTRALGDAWLRSESTAVARIPSAILPATTNYLLNPSHTDAAWVQIKRVTSAAYDPRLFRTMRG